MKIKTATGFNFDGSHPHREACLWCAIEYPKEDHQTQVSPPNVAIIIQIDDKSEVMIYNGIHYKVIIMPHDDDHLMKDTNLNDLSPQLQKECLKAVINHEN